MHTPRLARATRRLLSILTDTLAAGETRVWTAGRGHTAR